MQTEKPGNLWSVWNETHWYAIHTKPRQEALAATAVERLDVEVLLPKIKKEHWGRRHPCVVIKPLFPSYFFARFCSAISLDCVRFAHGVLNVISAGLVPLPVEDTIIHEIQSRHTQAGYIEMVALAFHPGDRVTIEEGPLAGWIGKVEREWDDGKRVAILLEALGRARVLIEKRWLRPVDAI